MRRDDRNSECTIPLFRIGKLFVCFRFEYQNDGENNNTWLHTHTNKK